MKKYIIIIAVLIIGGIAVMQYGDMFNVSTVKKTPPPPVAEMKKEAKKIIRKFSKAFGKKVKAGFKLGPDYAVHVFANDMPKLIKKTDAEFPNWEFRRIALEPFNKDSLAKGWEVEVLEDIVERKKNGEKKLSKLLYAKIVGDEFRYMKPQKLSNSCIKCHTNRRSEEIKESLESIYPVSNIIDAKRGDIIGAYSLVRKF